jgi:hypothetical protein
LAEVRQQQSAAGAFIGNRFGDVGHVLSVQH